MPSEPDTVAFVYNPFAAIRGRTILIILFSTIIASIIIICYFLPFLAAFDSWADISISLLWCGLMVWLLNKVVSRAGLNIPLLVGRIPSRAQMLRSALWAIPLVMLSIGCIWLVYLPLSSLFPGFVQFWLINDPIPVFWTDGPFVLFANIINLAVIAIFIPIIEEFVFRGLLISRWSVKWGVPRAILVSSLIFGFFHTDIVGAILFGYVMAILYIRTKSLIIPIIVHGANNLMAWLFAFWETTSQGPMVEYTLNDFRADWWYGAVGLIIGVPWVIRILVAHWPRSSWRMPYFAQQ